MSVYDRDSGRLLHDRHGAFDIPDPADGPDDGDIHPYCRSCISQSYGAQFHAPTAGHWKCGHLALCAEHHADICDCAERTS